MGFRKRSETEFEREIERRFAWFGGFQPDIVFGLRMMRGAPVITLAAVLSLALGIGANAAIASLVEAILWRSLPIPNPQQLRLVQWQAHGFPRDLVDASSGSMYRDQAVDVADFFAYPTFQTLRRSAQDRATVAAYNPSFPVSVAFEGRPTVADQRPVSGNFFAALLLRPAMGRLIVDQDDRSASPAVAVVSHRFWANALASDGNAIGKTLGVNNRAHVIVGVLAPEFFGLYPGDPTAIYVPIHHAASTAGWNPQDWLTKERAWGTQVIARLAPDTDPAQLRAHLDAVFRSSWTTPSNEIAQPPSLRLDEGARGLAASLTREFRNPLSVLGALVSLLLVIACANIANLLLARAVARRKEIAMRVSLGCSRARLVRQFLTESALIALAGGAASIAVAYATRDLLGPFVGEGESLPISIDGRMILSLVGAITAVSLAIFGVVPAWQAARLDASCLKLGGGSIGDSRARRWNSGRTLVVAQMTMSVVLVLAAVIFIRNLRAIQTADPGFDRRNLVVFGVRPGTSGYDKARLPQFCFDLEQRLASTPGVAGAGLAWMRPMNLGGWSENVQLGGQTATNHVSMNGVTPSYLPLYAPQLVAGRNLTWADIRSDAKVAVISEDLARKLGGSGTLGRTLYLTDGPPGQKRPGYEIVGIAPAFATTSMKERAYAMWVPLQKGSSEATVVVRTSQPPQAALPGIRRAMREVDPNLPMVDVVTMEEQIARILQRERMFATVCGGFGILAIALSVIGLYGVMAYSTSRRRGEIGVRLALGALPRQVWSMVMLEGLALALAGIVLAVPVVWLGAKYAEQELFRMKVFEPMSIALALGILVGAALVAVGAPAARASALQPSETLREQ